MIMKKIYLQNIKLSSLIITWIWNDLEMLSVAETIWRLYVLVCMLNVLTSFKIWVILYEIF